MSYATFQVNWWSLNLMKIVHHLFEIKLTPKDQFKCHFEYILKMAHNLHQNYSKCREIYIKNKELYVLKNPYNVCP